MNKNEKLGLLTKINKEIDETYHKLALHYNISDSSLWVIYALYHENKPCSQMEICKEWYMNKQTVNSAIKNLEKLGYVKKDNSQSKKISLTPLGLDFAKKNINEVSRIEDIAYSKISDEELESMLEVLQKMLSSLKDEVDKIIYVDYPRGRKK